MYTLDLRLDPSQRVFNGLKMTPVGDRYRLDTPLDSAVVIVATNLLEVLKTIPKGERDRLVITGAVPPQLLLTAQAMLGPHFRTIEFFDGARNVTITIPTPPDDHQGDPE